MSKAPASGAASIAAPLAVLFLATLAAQFISLRFGRLDLDASMASMWLPSLLFLSVLTLPACWIGLKLGPSLGLGAPRLVALMQGQPGRWTALRNDVLIASGLGLVLGALLLGLRFVLQPMLPDALPAYGFRGVAGGFAVSIGAAVGEEVWFRLGLMTLLVGLATRLRSDRQATAPMVIAVILLVSVAFGAAHLPQLAAHGAASPFAVGATVLGNVLVGVLYGWCYWKRGLLAAIAAHFSVDLVLHVFPAMV